MEQHGRHETCRLEAAYRRSTSTPTTAPETRLSRSSTPLTLRTDRFTEPPTAQHLGPTSAGAAALRFQRCPPGRPRSIRTPIIPSTCPTRPTFIPPPARTALGRR